MTQTEAQTDTSIASVIQLSARRARNSGLWAALASQVSTSAAGSGLAGPTRPGQPISSTETSEIVLSDSPRSTMPVPVTDLSNVVGMFEYRAEHAVPITAA